MLKAISTTEANQDRTHFRYGLREVFAYRSDLLENLPGGLAAPACYGTVQMWDDLFWIWLEEIKEENGIAWTLDNYGCAARHLGQFNGAYLAGMPLPTYRWLSQDWMRMWLRTVTPPRQQLRDLAVRPLLARFTPPDVVKGMIHVWDSLQIWLEALDRLPQTLCHLDAYPRNLYAQHPARTVAIDWADMGIAAIGADLSCLVASSILFFEADLDSAQELDRVCYANYLDGLADAGWRGDPRLSRFGFAASAALRWSFAPSAGFVVENRELMEQVMRRPLDEIIERICGVHRFVLKLADEARELLPVVSSL
jgi:hypothetical protein